jgi:hypothetical protein
MNAEEAKALGYEVIEVSPFEVGLVQNFDCGHSEGVRTWWASDFNGKLPPLDHPLILKTIEINERYKNGRQEDREPPLQQGEGV